MAKRVKRRPEIRAQALRTGWGIIRLENVEIIRITEFMKLLSSKFIHRQKCRYFIGK